MPVPLLDLKTQNDAVSAELREAFERVLNSGHFILGREVDTFEQNVAQFTGAKHAIGVSSGTDALLLALMSLGIGPGDEVLCPSFTFFATAGCVARVGARPVFVDADANTFNIDVADARRRITSRTKAIIPVHLFGQACDMDDVNALAAEHRLAVIEDAAQSFGATYRGRQLGTLGTFGAFSFFPSKNLGGFGDAGMLVTNDDVLAEKARVLRVHGAKPKYVHKQIGANFRIDALQAALLSVKLAHLNEYCRRRAENAAYYSERLSGCEGKRQKAEGRNEEVRGQRSGEESAICNFKSSEATGSARVSRAVSGVSPNTGGEAPASDLRPATSDLKSALTLPTIAPDRTHIWNQYTLRVHGEGRRDALKNFLSERQIGCEIYYPIPLHKQECFARFAGMALDTRPSTLDSTADRGLQNSDLLASEVLSIPVYPELKRDQQDDVIAAVEEFFRSQK